MKSKIQKQEELKKGEKFLKESQSLIIFDVSKIPTNYLNKLRAEFRKAGDKILVIKKRLLALLLKKEGIEFDPKQAKLPLATVFTGNIEDSARAIASFFKALEAEKIIKGSQIIGGFNLKEKVFIDPEIVKKIGSLPPKKVLLSQLAAMIASPISSLLYVLGERSKKVGN